MFINIGLPCFALIRQRERLAVNSAMHRASFASTIALAMRRLLQAPSGCPGDSVLCFIVVYEEPSHQIDISHSA